MSWPWKIFMDLWGQVADFPLAYKHNTLLRRSVLHLSRRNRLCRTHPISLTILLNPVETSIEAELLVFRYARLVEWWFAETAGKSGESMVPAEDTSLLASSADEQSSTHPDYSFAIFCGGSFLISRDTVFEGSNIHQEHALFRLKSEPFLTDYGMPLSWISLILSSSLITFKQFSFLISVLMFWGSKFCILRMWSSLLNTTTHDLTKQAVLFYSPQSSEENSVFLGTEIPIVAHIMLYG